MAAPSRSGLRSPDPDTPDARPFARRLLLFVALLGGLWASFLAAHLAMNFTLPGSDAINALAQETIHRGTLFPDSVTALRVVAFGDSRTQTGFVPDVFDAASENVAYSYNLGLPNETRFVEVIRTLVRRGEIPDVVLLTNSWADAPEPSGLGLLRDDHRMMDELFPFRGLLTNTARFLLRSTSRGGPVAYARQVREYVDEARRNRGYFFVEAMSLFPGHRLPETFRAEGDDEDLVETRDLEPSGPLFEELVALRKEAGFRAIYVPTYRRVGSRHASSPNSAQAAALAAYGLERVGPDYWLYPNSYFSDRSHLNPQGAQVYTRDLWNLLAPILREEASQRKLARR